MVCKISDANLHFYCGIQMYFLYCNLCMNFADFLHLCQMNDTRYNKLQFALEKRQPDLTVVLENVFDPHNVAAVMRTCDSVGIKEIFVIQTQVPTYKNWGRKSSSGAIKWLQVHYFDTVAECLQEVKKRYDKVYTTHLAENSKSLYQLNLTERVALVFGNERSGCSNEMIKFADGNFIIPQVGIIESLNISVACAISIYEAFRQKTAAGHYENPKIHGEEKVELLRHWELYDDYVAEKSKL